MLNPDQADKLLNANLSNILNKLKAGKTLTKAELDVVERAKSGKGPRLKAEITMEEIAARSGVAPKTVQRWYKKEPWLPALDGDKLVAFFKLDHADKTVFLDTHRAEHVQPEEETPGRDSMTYSPRFPPGWADGVGLRREVWRLETACQVIAKEIQRLAEAGSPELSKAQKDYVFWVGEWRQLAKDAPKALQELNDSISKEEAQAEWMETLSAVSKLLDNLPVRLAKLICGVPVPEGIERAERQLASVKRKLASGMCVGGELPENPLDDAPEPAPKPKKKGKAK